MTTQKTVIVANRLPISVVRGDDGELEYVRSNGGLATAMASLGLEDTVWIGWPGIASDDLSDSERQEITECLEADGAVPVFLTHEQVALFYEGFSNDTLWPLMHYFPSRAVYRDEYWRVYREVNQLYANAARDHLTDTTRIWVHDYQLMLLPAMLREAQPEALIGYFHHIPFPSYEVFRLVPQRVEILEGLLGADLIGFHTYDYARHFLSSVLRIAGKSNTYGLILDGDRATQVDAFPISIDVAQFEQARRSKPVRAAAAAIRHAHPYDTLLLSIDRLDYSKGILERLEGYRLFLEQHPEYREKIQLVMVAVPSRTEVAAYAQLRDVIEQTVGRINGAFGTTGWQPISYQFQNLPFDDIVGLYKEADALLVTPLRDGMNLVAKEYVIAKGGDAGVLILSELAGAAEELPEALMVNPSSGEAVAQAIFDAVTMPRDEQQQRLTGMQARIRRYPVQEWGRDFLDSLDYTYRQRTEYTTSPLRAAEIASLQASLKAAHRPLFVFDYDGTLRSFVNTSDPAKAIPSDDVLKTLHALARRGIVAIVSGRSREALELWFGATSFVLIAEHGAEYRVDGEWRQTDVDFEPVRELITPVLTDYVSRTPGSSLEQKHYSSVWHYRLVSNELAHVRRYNLIHALRSLVKDHDIAIHTGSKIVEIKPKAINKGVALEWLMQRYSPDFVLIAGDDYTDEDMFHCAPDDAWTIKVSQGETDARYRVANVAQMVRVLSRL